MSEKPLPFVVNDRRKFTSEGELRPESERAPDPEPRPVRDDSAAHAPVAATGPIPISGPADEAGSETDHAGAIAAKQYSQDDHNSEVAQHSQDASSPYEDGLPGPDGEPAMPPPPTAEQMERARLAFEATADRLDVAIRSANPGMDHPPPMSFEQLVQSVYMQSILQLGGGAQDGQQPQVDILGARQSIDMLAVLSEKTANNLSEIEQRLLDSALFELRMAFLEITQALARSAQQRAAQQPNPSPFAPGSPTPPNGPRIVR